MQKLVVVLIVEKEIPFIPIENEKCIFPFKITQFPICLSFAMTLNKTQGQTLDYVGIYFYLNLYSLMDNYMLLYLEQHQNPLRS